MSRSFKIRLLHPSVGAVAFPLMPGASLVVGRQSAVSDVEISWDPRISRRHCQLWEENGQVWFRDLTSRNGSWIGEERVSGMRRLKPGTSVVMGDTRLVVPDDSEATEADLGSQETADMRRASPRDGVAIAPERPASSSSRRVPLPRADTNVDAQPPHLEVTVAAPPIHPPEEEGLQASNVPGEFSHPTPTTRVLRVTPELVSPTRVEVEVQSPAELKDLWIHDLSKGGLFVGTENPPSTATALEILLKTPTGGILLHGTVVQVITEERSGALGGQAGVGIQFTDLHASARAAIQAYADGHASTLNEVSGDAPGGSGDAEGALMVAQRLLRESQTSDYYRALVIPPVASNKQIYDAVASVHGVMSDAMTQASPPQAARLEAAMNLLLRMRRVLSHPESRLEHDFRHGHARAQERIRAAQAGRGLSLAQLRRTWRRVFPSEADKAMSLAHEAVAARKRYDLLAAIKAGREALKHDPFFVELLQSVEVWESDRRPVSSAGHSFES